MNTQEMLDPESWAKQTFGLSKLKDIRRTGRAVKVAGRMAENASASLPAQMQTWKETIALYRLLNEDDVTFEALMQPHWQQTREQIETRPVVLLVQDTTEVDLSHHPKTKGLGQVGNERGRSMNYIQIVVKSAVIGKEFGTLIPLFRLAAYLGERFVLWGRNRKESLALLWQERFKTVFLPLSSIKVPNSFPKSANPYCTLYYNILFLTDPAKYL